MLKIGDKVTHVDYPQPVGRVVAKQRWDGLVLVLWGDANPEFRYTSKHIPSALRPVQKPR